MFHCWQTQPNFFFNVFLLECVFRVRRRWNSSKSRRRNVGKLEENNLIYFESALNERGISACISFRWTNSRVDFVYRFSCRHIRKVQSIVNNLKIIFRNRIDRLDIFWYFPYEDSTPEPIKFSFFFFFWIPLFLLPMSNRRRWCAWSLNSSIFGDSLGNFMNGVRNCDAINANTANRFLVLALDSCSSLTKVQ